MAELFERWNTYRDEKIEVNRRLGDLSPNKALSEEEAQQEARLVQRYNDLYALMYQLQSQFTGEDWEAYEADQAEIRQAERQAWLIKNRYGYENPPGGIADWWATWPR